MRCRSWGRGGRQTAATLAVLAILAAAFLAGVLVGSGRTAAASSLIASQAVFTSRPSAAPPRSDDAAGASDPSPPTDASVNPRAPETLPACAYANTRATLDPWRQWNTIVLDTATALRPSDAPADLVDTGLAGLNRGHLIRAIVIDDLRTMARAARAAGARLTIQSAYRSFAEQAETLAYWVVAAGRHEALRRSARPGHSEHQLGTTIDFSSSGAPPWAGHDWARTDAGAWLMRNAWRYGFVLSYPRGARDVTCYGYEPWHYRYVGRTVAAAIHASGMAPREWLLRP